MKPVVSSFHNRFTQKNYFSFYPHYQVKNAVLTSFQSFHRFIFVSQKKICLRCPRQVLAVRRKKNKDWTAACVGLAEKSI